MKAHAMTSLALVLLKATGVSGFEGDKLVASSHKDPKMLKVYDLKKVVVATE